MVDEVEESFLEEAAAFLEEAARSHAVTTDQASGRIALFPDLTPEEETEELRVAREWRARRFDAGFGWLSGPVEYGGRGLSLGYERAYLKLERQYRFPSQRIYDVGLGMVAPMILRYATDMAKRRYLAAMHRGDLVGCQLFSEPGAGSDLAGMTTRALRVEGGWRVNGQKVWSSGAHLSDIGILACRTGAVEDRHRNLTVLLLPMSSPGVTVRPIRQMTGGASFNEVFFEDVFVPEELQLGEVHQGWEVVLATLAHERAAVGGPTAGGNGVLRTQRLADLLARSGRLKDGAVRDELMRLHCSLTVARLTRQRADAHVRAGNPPGPEMSLGKLSLTNNLSAVARLVGLALGPRLVADSGEQDAYAWAEFLLGVPGLRLGGGTDEIQRNILAERVLGLPR